MAPDAFWRAGPADPTDRRRACVSSTHDINAGIPRGIPGPDPAASRRFGWERTPLATSTAAEAGRMERVAGPALIAPATSIDAGWYVGSAGGLS